MEKYLLDFGKGKLVYGDLMRASWAPKIRQILQDEVNRIYRITEFPLQVCTDTVVYYNRTSIDIPCKDTAGISRLRECYRWIGAS